MQSTSAVYTRDISYDVIRFVAILFVFSIHCMAGLDAHKDTGVNIFASNLLTSIQHIGVPLFVMLSGALLLGKQESPYVFLKKRMSRVLVPFLVWSVILFGIYCVLEPNRYPEDTNSYPLLFVKLLCFSGIHRVYWYVYMILGLYLITPILQRFAQAADEKCMRYACLLIAGVVVMSALLPDFLVTKRMVSDNLPYLGYFITGFYIRKHIAKRKGTVRVFATVSVLLLVLSLCNQCMSFMPDDSVIIYFLSIAVFGSMQKTELKDGPLHKFVTFVSRTSYGMYLSHVLLISIFIKLGMEELMPMAIVPVVMTLAILVMESVMMYVIEKCRLSKILGG